MQNTKRVLYLCIFVMLLAGCAKKSDNSISRVEEISTIPEETSENIIETYTVDWGEGLNGVEAYMIEYYISDDHFYNQKELDFTVDGFIETSPGGYHEFGDPAVTGDEFHIKLSDAYIFESPTEFGEYLSGKYVDRIIERAKREYGDQNMAWLCVPAEITNIRDDKRRIYINSWELFKRVKDDRLVEYGFADKYVMPCSVGILYDYSQNIDSGTYYILDVEPHETIHTNLLYFLPKDDLNEELYINLYYVAEGNDKKNGYPLPPQNKETKYMKVYIKEG